MATKKYTPTVNTQEFDVVAPQLRAALKFKYDAAKNDADRPPANPVTQGAFDHMPDLDSKTVARWSPVVKDHIGCKLDPDLIRKGGYNSFEEFWTDIQPKLRSVCPQSAGIEAAVEVGTVR